MAENDDTQVECLPTGAHLRAVVERHIELFLTARGSSNVDVFTAMPAIVAAMYEVAHPPLTREPPLTEQEIDQLMERWDQTAPNLQRKIMAETSMRLFKTKRALAEAQHALADARPPLTRERVAATAAELFDQLDDDGDWDAAQFADDLCRLLGVEGE